MCESNVYMKDSEGERLVMEDAVVVEDLGGTVRVRNILGEELELDGDIEEITFLEHRIVIQG